MTFESLTAASSKKHVSKRADKHRSGFRTNPLSVFPTLRRFFFLGRGLDNVNFPPRTLISWWTFTQARRATPYLPANRLNEVEREKREKGYSLRFGSTRRFFGRTSHGYGDTFPRVSVDFRQESVDRGTRGYNETQNRINRVYTFGWRKVHLLFPPSVSEEGGRDWAGRFEGKFHRVLNLRRRKGDGSISFTAAYDHRSEARSKSRSSDRRCKSDLPFGDPTNPQDSRGYFIRRLRLDNGGIRGGVRRFLSNPSRPLLVLMRSQWSVPSSGVDTVQTT